MGIAALLALVGIQWPAARTAEGETGAGH